MDFDFPEIEEYFIYNPKMTYPTGTPSPGSLGGSNSGIKIAKDAITYCTSGLVDRNKVQLYHTYISPLKHSIN